jgi:hypothetical protein
MANFTFELPKRDPGVVVRHSSKVYSRNEDSTGMEPASSLVSCCNELRQTGRVVSELANSSRTVLIFMWSLAGQDTSVSSNSTPARSEVFGE